MSRQLDSFLANRADAACAKLQRRGIPLPAILHQGLIGMVVVGCGHTIVGFRLETWGVDSITLGLSALSVVLWWSLITKYREDISRMDEPAVQERYRREALAQREYWLWVMIRLMGVVLVVADALTTGASLYYGSWQPVELLGSLSLWLFVAFFYAHCAFPAHPNGRARNLQPAYQGF